MTISTAASGTQTATVTTEHTLAALEVTGKFWLKVDLVNLAAADDVTLRIKAMTLTGGTVRVLRHYQFYDAQPTDALIFLSEEIVHDLTDTDSLVFTLQQNFGTGRNFPWAVIRDDAAGISSADVTAAVWDAAMSGHVTSGTFGQRLAAIRTGTAAGGAAGSITLDGSASASDAFYTNALVLITGGTGANQVRTISGYTGATKVATVTPNWVTAPDNTSIFVIIPAGAAAGVSVPSAADVADAVWDEALSGHLTAGSAGQALAGARANTAQSGPSSTSITLDASASAVDDLYNGMTISITAGTGAGQSRQIVDYVGATKVATIVPPWGTNPANDSVFVIKHAAAPIPVDNADALLNRPLASVTGDSTRRVVDALRFLRNRWRIVTGTLQVYKEDDTTVAWSGTATQTAGDPVSEVEPS